MVIYLDEYLNRRRMRSDKPSWLPATTGLAPFRGLAPYTGHPQRIPSSAHFLGSAALALSPDAITLPSASDLGLVYAEATLI